MQCPSCQLDVPSPADTCPFCGAPLSAASTAPRARVRRRVRARDWLAAYLFLAPNILGFLTFTLFPVLAALFLSFVSWDVIRPFFPQDEESSAQRVRVVLSGEPGEHARYVGIDNYREFLGLRRDENGSLVANEPAFWKYAYNTVYLMAGIPIGMVLSLICALLMNQQLRGIVAHRTIYFLPSVCAVFAISLLWRWIYEERYGLLNAAIIWLGNALGLEVHPPAWLNDPTWAKPALIIMGLWMGVGGYNCILYLAGLQGIPAELYEAADIDGAGWWHQLRHITWPMLSPTTFFIFVMSVIAGFQGAFVQVDMMTGGGPAGATTTLIYYIYQHAFVWFKMGRACALAMILFVVVFSATLANWRFGKKAVHYQ